MLVALAFACSRPPEPETRTKVAGGSWQIEPVVTRVNPPRDAAELCGNAYDDNGNGPINEGCNEPQGELHVVIAWLGESEVDLFVFDPNGAVAPLGSATAEGLVRTRDCPGEGQICGGNNQESVVHEGASLKAGRYRVVVRAARISGPRVRVELGVRSPQETRASVIEFVRPDTEFAFELIVNEGPADEEESNSSAR